jgi:hypothetical protein
MNYNGPELPPTMPQPPKRHRIRKAFGIAGALVLAVIFISIIGSAMSGSPKGTRSQIPATPVYTPAAPVASTAPATVTPPAPVYVVFTVTGSAPSGASVMYGSDADVITPAGTLGVLGDGVALPFTATMKFDPSAMYYNLTAQLEGSGSITSTITIKRAGYSDLVVSHGSATGGYNIASAQAAPASTDGSSWTPEG